MSEERRQQPMWQIRVTLPYGVVTDDALNALFAAVADAVYDWEPANRDGWDVDVDGGPAR